MAFTDINSPQYYGKTGIPDAYAALDANFALLESGGAGAVTVDSLVCTAGATFGGGAAATGVTISTDGIVTMGAQGTGVTIATATPFGLEIHSQHASDVVAGATGLSCGIRSRYEISVAQTTLASLVAIEGRLRVKAALADGNHAGVMGTIESDASIAFTGTSTTQRSAGAFAIELGASCTLSAGFLCGIAIDSSVNGNVDMSNVEFCGIRIKTSSSKEIWEHGLYIDDGGAVTGITLGTCTTGISIGVCTTAISAVNPINVAIAQATATTGTVRAVYGKQTSFTSMTSGNLVGVRGEVTVGGSVSTGVYLYGTQGKLIGGANTITAGSGQVCGVLGQIDVSGTTLASGWIAGVHADIYGANAGGFAMNLISGTHAGGGVINALLSLFGKSDYVFELTSNTHTNMSSTGTPGAVTGATGWIKVLVDGAARYIALTDSVS